MKLGATSKSGLLATAALAASLAVLPALANDPAGHPTERVAAVEMIADPAFAMEDEPLPAGRLAGLAALIAALAAAFNWDRLGRLFNRAAPAVKAAAAAVVAAPGVAARAVGKVVAKPFRWVLAAFSLALFSLLGFGMYDVEWAAGVIAGVAAVLLFWVSSARLGRLVVRGSVVRGSRRGRSS